MTPIMLPVKRACVDVWTVTAVLGCTTEDCVFGLIEEGKLAALNVSYTAGRRCVRVLTASLADYVVGKKATRTPDEVMAALFPGHHETVARTNVARALNTSVQTVARLHRRGLLTAAGRVRCPANESPRITRTSLAGFVKARLL